MALGVLVRLVFVLATRPHELAGDEPEYEIEGRFAADGKFLWTTTPYGEAHATTFKAPGYAAWVGLLYRLGARTPDDVFVVQAIVLTPIVIGLAWLLGRSLFSPGVGVATAFVVAVYPNAWQFDVRLWSEALANPLTVLALLLVLTARTVTWRRAAVVGAVLGVLLLIKPSSVLLVAPIAVVWWGTAGLRGGTVRLAASLVVALLVVLPWSIRNYALDSEHFVPLSVQSAAWYGVFNDDAANDELYPWAWRPFPSSVREIVRVPRSDGELYRDLNALAWDYVREHPSSVPKAFFWNGLSRLWDVRRPSMVQREAELENRSRVLSGIGLAMYWPLLLLAIAGLVLAWRGGRHLLVVAVLATALSASVLYTSDATTRYRAPFEPLVVALAMSAVAVAARRRARPGLGST